MGSSDVYIEYGQALEHTLRHSANIPQVLHGRWNSRTYTLPGLDIELVCFVQTIYVNAACISIFCLWGNTGLDIRRANVQLTQKNARSWWMLCYWVFSWVDFLLFDVLNDRIHHPAVPVGKTKVRRPFAQLLHFANLQINCMWVICMFWN